MLRIGITMRITDADGYSDPRDSISQDWFKFFQREFGEDLWVALPNLGYETINYFKKLNLNVLILSGGDNLGQTPLRDESERHLLSFAIKNNIPIIGVCRGMQVIHEFFGGRIDHGSEGFVQKHRATQHFVRFADEDVILNSFHNNIIREDTISDQLTIEARCKYDNSVESFRGEKILGIMWHPERPMPDWKWSTRLIKDFLKEEVC